MISNKLILAAFAFCLIPTSVFAKTAKKPETTVAPGVYINANGSPIIPLIESAVSSIDIEIYTMYDANVRNAIRDAITKKIPIRIVQEPAPDGDSCQPFTSAASTDNANCTDEKLLISQVKAAGGTYVAYNKANLCPSPKSSCFLHGKLIVVDQTTAMISTGNYDATNLCDLSEHPANCDRDYSFVDQDTDVVGALEQIVNYDVIGNSYDLSSIVTGTVAQKLTVSPLSLPPLVAFVQSAKNTLDVENQYLEQTDWNNALIAAGKSGVKVNVQVSSVCWYSTPTSSEAKSFTKIYQGFDSAGINSSLFTKQILIDGTPGYMHAKVMVADGNKAWLGSVNGSNAATSNNREFGVFFNNPAWVETIDQQILADHNAAGAETWQQSVACTKD